MDDVAEGCWLTEIIAVPIGFHPVGTVRVEATSEGAARAKTDSYVSPGCRCPSLYSLHPGSIHLRTTEDATAEVPPSETSLQDLLASQKPVKLVHW